MFFQSSTEEKFRTNEKKLKELGIQLEKLSNDVDEFYDTHELDAEEIEKYYADSANFNEEELELLQMLLKHHEKKIADIKKVADPKELKKKYQERVVDPRWLFVR